MRIAFVHPDLGIGGAERLIVDAAVGLQSLGHKVHVFTSHHDSQHCFQETRDGTLNVTVLGDFLPTTLFGYGMILCAILRNVWLAINLFFRWNSSDSTFGAFDIIIVDQLSVCIPILKLRSTRILFYCHFPDLLLSKQGSFLKRLYRLPFDWLEEVII
jgi:alpha-1,3/alpha-1,6-mannosyltransferase